MTRHDSTARFLSVAASRSLSVACVLIAMAGSLPALPRPLAEYRFEEGSGTTVFNSGSVVGGAGTLQEGRSAGNGPRFSQDTPQGIGSRFSLEFDGINDLVRMPDFLNYTKDFQGRSQNLDQCSDGIGRDGPGQPF